MSDDERQRLLLRIDEQANVMFQLCAIVDDTRRFLETFVASVVYPGKFKHNPGELKLIANQLLDKIKETR